MRNDTAKWPAPAVGPRGQVQAQGITLDQITLPRQVLISGPRDAAMALAGTTQATGWPDVAMGDHYALSLRRDRILMVGGQIDSFGWRADVGLATSDIGTGYTVFSLQGPRAEKVLRTGTELSEKIPSASCLRLWNGYDILLYRHTATDRYLLHVGSALAEGLWDMLNRQIRMVSA
ncbi:hypothetical protein [Yoonia sediminilitoris]|uniref:Sarcosine oxidase gamma subunit n=1 Tax=Yoonia sediminilitoris TaxID=1286148 RepID=A0A2T6KJX2_9RHOB|nr:hypothetical protein [Yoonia sediminilitoris]PUB16270.1 sarcosine oxidase gamma subunit [Yoonia sediminilitoris]RCW96619.1 sarcosine oxidase gamma subunit [Yoonia sediminilitoris]